MSELRKRPKGRDLMSASFGNHRFASTMTGVWLIIAFILTFTSKSAVVPEGCCVIASIWLAAEWLNVQASKRFAAQLLLDRTVTRKGA